MHLIFRFTAILFFIKSLHSSEIDCEHKKTTSFTESEAILEAFSSQGYCEFENYELSASWYDELYRQFEAVLTCYRQDLQFRKMLDAADQEFGNRRVYGSAPMGMLIEERTNKPKKSYFHYCEEYSKFIKESFPNLFNCEIFSNFLTLLEKLREVSDQAFSNAVEVFEEADIRVSAILKNDAGRFSTVVKVVCYEPGPINGSSPHIDFSGLSLLLDHSDSEESLVIAPYMETLKWSDFLIPKRNFARGDTTSALLLPGLALKAAGLPIEPTPHAVLAIDQKRFAVISFAMSPQITLTYDQIKLKIE